MRKLPHWCITDKSPAFYDTDSATAIEQTAKLYGAMNELIDEFNKFVDTVNQSIEEFENGMNENYEEFTTGLRQEFQDFIDVIEMKIQNVEDVNKLMETLRKDLNATAQTIINEAIENGTLTVVGVYDEETESYNLITEGAV